MPPGGGMDGAVELAGREWHDRIALRSLRPLPCSTRSSMRSESISPTLSATTSETRSPAPYAVASAALYFGPGAAWSSSVTSSTLSTAGNRRGSRTMVSRRARSGRSSVYGEEETQGRDRTVDAWWLHAGLRLVQLEAAQILRRRRVGRPADEGCERPHVANVVIARLLSEVAYPHVLDHARPQRADRRCEGWEVIGSSSLKPKIAGPSMLGI